MNDEWFNSISLDVLIIFILDDDTAPEGNMS